MAKKAKTRKGEQSANLGGAQAEAKVVSKDDAALLTYRGQRYDFADQVGHLLRKAYQRHTAIFQELAVEPQMTSVQSAVLFALVELGPSSLTALGRVTAIDPATMRGVVERLEARGYIALAPDEVDGRRLVVMLTEAGRDACHRMVPQSLEITRRTLADLNPAEQLALIFLLKKIGN